VLAGAGIGWKRAAQLAGISTGAMSKLLYGGPGDRPPSQRIRPQTAAAILAVRPSPAALAPTALADATGTHRRIQALVACGWSQARIGRRLGMSPGNFGAMMRREQVTAGTAAAIRRLYDELWNRRPPQDEWREKIAAARSRNYARAHGWAPPLAWDDDRIDQPDAQPAEGWQRPARTKRTAAELAEDAADVIAQGHTTAQAAERLGVTTSTVQHAFRRARTAAGRVHDSQRARFAAARQAAQAPEINAEAG
jgi:DNA-binding NarL/FixJ family response regulator